MIILNKKKITNEYGGKWKISKFNKDINLMGKIWTMKFKDIVIPKTMTKNQFCCSKEEGITTENFLTRRAVNFLRGEGGEEKDGTLLALDFKDAFRSTSHRWIAEVFKKMKMPKKI